MDSNSPSMLYFTGRGWGQAVGTTKAQASLTGQDTLATPTPTPTRPCYAHSLPLCGRGSNCGLPRFRLSLLPARAPSYSFSCLFSLLSHQAPALHTTPPTPMVHPVQAQREGESRESNSREKVTAGTRGRVKPGHGTQRQNQAPVLCTGCADGPDANQ